MTYHSPARFRRDAGASAFAFGAAGVALAFHAVSTMRNQWPANQLTLDALDPHGQARTVLINIENIPAWVTPTLHTADVVQWSASAVVLVLLSLCVIGMLRGNVFSSSTARWAGWAGGVIVVFMIAVPAALRIPASNMALQSEPGDWTARIIGHPFWYLYVGAMTLSFLALVLRRGSQLQQDQAGLI